MKRNNIHYGGFTLVEVIVSVVIIGILASGIFALTSYSGRLSMRAQQKVTAISLIEKKINELKAGGVDNLSLILNGAPVVSVSDPPVTITSIGALVTQGTLTTTIRETVPADASMKEVKVQLTWTDPFGGAHVESAVTAIYQQG